MSSFQGNGLSQPGIFEAHCIYRGSAHIKVNGGKHSAVLSTHQRQSVGSMVVPSIELTELRNSDGLIKLKSHSEKAVTRALLDSKLNNLGNKRFVSITHLILHVQWTESLARYAVKSEVSVRWILVNPGFKAGCGSGSLRVHVSCSAMVPIRGTRRLFGQAAGHKIRRAVLCMLC